MADCLSVTVMRTQSLHLIYDQGCYSPFTRICLFSVDSRNFKKWGQSPTTAQNVGAELKNLGDNFLISLN